MDVFKRQYLSQRMPNVGPLFPRKLRRYIIILILIIWIGFIIQSSEFFTRDHFVFEEFDNEKCINHSHTKQRNGSHWMVLTSVINPTDDVKALSKLPGYTMVVVGDKSTPKNWSCPGVIFLSYDMQHKMKYGIAKVLPDHSYSRKMIGYLYAIENGATAIHETDDDNSPFNDLKAFNLGQRFEGLEVHANSGPYNHFPHFGQVSAWPRGYPITDIYANQSRTYRRVSLEAPAIRNGAVDQDPDVDALFRLTRKFSKGALNISFDETAPPIVIPYKVLTPFNAQTTTFLTEAFWSMFLPPSVTFRVMDIWRSYWVQPLLWLIKQKLVFVQITAKQVPHRVRSLAEFRGERLLYEYSKKFTKTVLNWNCPFLNFEKCAIDLAETIANAELWAQSDVTVLKIWLNDLKKLCYKIPQIKDKQTDFLPLSREPVKFYPKEQKTVMAHVKYPIHVPQ